MYLCVYDIFLCSVDVPSVAGKSLSIIMQAVARADETRPHLGAVNNAPLAAWQFRAAQESAVGKVRSV